jgi:methanogenic corrinoid protein MtbC1
VSDGALERLKHGLLDLDMPATLDVASSIVDGDVEITAKEAVDAISESLQVVGKRFQDGEWFLAELVYAGEIASEVIKLLSPLMQGDASESLDTIVVGTVAGDLHDLGKNIFINHARSVGFRVIDLGIDVSTERFIQSVKEHKPIVLGMSCIMTTMTGSLERVVEQIRKQGLRDEIKIIIGGAALTEQYAGSIGVDAFAPDAVTGTDIIKGWSGSP